LVWWALNGQRLSPDRDAQFAHINAEAEEHIAAGQPVISVDGKKKELVGNFRGGGREYRPAGEPVATSVYDFKGELGKVTPYGVYDMAANTGWVSVGSDHDTGAFAVESIRRWWDKGAFYAGIPDPVISRFGRLPIGGWRFPDQAIGHLHVPRLGFAR